MYGSAGSNWFSGHVTQPYTSARTDAPFAVVFRGSPHHRGGSTIPASFFMNSFILNTHHKRFQARHIQLTGNVSSSENSAIPLPENFYGFRPSAENREYGHVLLTSSVRSTRYRIRFSIPSAGALFIITDVVVQVPDNPDSDHRQIITGSPAWHNTAYLIPWPVTLRVDIVIHGIHRKRRRSHTAVQQ